ncbi:MAG: TIGR04290 family methyltransferase [Nitriliruptorales bacterium]|nr:TIGR04290 family methyltransferase [Nitriliruptorales bacterium]
MTLQSLGGDSPDDEIGRQIRMLAPWFHNLHLPTGHQTAPDHPLADYPSYKWRQLEPHIPQDLQGWRVLDIGCNAGFYTFEVAARGAHVLAIDQDEHYLTQARWAAEMFGMSGSVEFERRTIYDLADTAEAFDLVVFMGVLYHLRYPLLALDLVADLTDKLLVLQTLTMPGDDVDTVPDDLPLAERHRMLSGGWPKMAFIEGRLADDHTNWWAPNHAAVEAMVRSTGLRVTARPGHEIYLCEPAPDVQVDRSELDLAVRRARQWKKVTG